METTGKSLSVQCEFDYHSFAWFHFGFYVCMHGLGFSTR